MNKKIDGERVAVDAVQGLLDREAIRDLVYSYSLFADTNRPDALADLFTQDCYVDVSPIGGRGVRGRENLRSFQQEILTKPTWSPDTYPVRTSHHNSNVLIEFIDPDHAQVRTSCYSWHEMNDGTFPEIWGYYDDKMTRTADGWRIAYRVLHVYGDSGLKGNWNPGERHNA
jgi:3-phenylpropionate/cinnamic acid dioxygenase small subunit